MASKSKIVLNGQAEIIREIQRLGGTIEDALVDAIELSGRNATNRFREVARQHEQTGIMAKSLVENPKAVNQGNEITMQTGFDMNQGGVPALWLDRGTPKQRPLNYVRKIRNDNAVKGSIDYILGQAWRSLL